MKKGIWIIVLLIAPSTFAEEDLGLIIPYMLLSSELDSNLPVDSAVFEFEFTGTIADKFLMRYSIDGAEDSVVLRRKEHLILKTTPGIHDFEFYVVPIQEAIIIDLREVSMTDIRIASQRHDSYSVNMQVYEGGIQVIGKPVIYLYTEEKTAVKVTIDIHGTHEFLYPSYQENWEFIAHPNGELTFDEGTYNYLFWEANAINSYNLQHTKSGFFVEKDEVVLFLEEKLTQAKLSTKEQADFITFWAPRLAQNELNLVHFIFNDACNEFAHLEISPTPDNIYRIFMFWQPIEEAWELEPQFIENIDRSGFSVIEWGGMEIAPSDKNTAL